LSVVLLTRPAEDAEDFAARLAELGHSAVVAPLLSLRSRDHALALDGIQAVLATSANGVRAFARAERRRDLPLFAVGPQTAAEARKLGFAMVRDAAGDAAALAGKAALWAAPDRGALLHVTGSETAGNLAGALEAKGFRVERAKLYEMVAAENLPTAAARALAEDSLDAAMFFSPRSARTFADCAMKAQLETHCARLIAIAISAATASALAPLQFAETRIASAPNQDAMLSALTP
jgi:uroporphyrinogen-III synthase